MGGPFPQGPEVGAAGHQAGSEVPLPDPVDHHARRQGVVGAGNEPGQLQAAALVAVDDPVTAPIQDLKKTARDQLAGIVVVSADQDPHGSRAPVLDRHHGQRIRGGAGAIPGGKYFHFRHMQGGGLLLPRSQQFHPHDPAGGSPGRTNPKSLGRSWKLLGIRTLGEKGLIPHLLSLVGQHRDPKVGEALEFGIHAIPQDHHAYGTAFGQLHLPPGVGVSLVGLLAVVEDPVDRLVRRGLAPGAGLAGLAQGSQAGHGSGKPIGVALAQLAHQGPFLPLGGELQIGHGAGTLEDGGQGVVVGGGDGVELVVVAAAAGQGQAQEGAPRNVDLLVGYVQNELLLVLLRQRLGAQHQEPGGHHPVAEGPPVGVPRKEVAGKLLQNKSIVGLVLVEGPHHVIAVAVGVAHDVVAVVGGGVGIADHVQPVAGPALAVVGGVQQALHQVRVGLGRRVIDKGFDLPGFRRQTQQVEVEPANQPPAVRGRSRPQTPGLQPGQDEPVQPGAGPRPVLDFRRLSESHGLEGPKGFFFLGELGNGLRRVPGKQDVVFLPQVGLHRPPLRLGVGVAVENHFRQVAPERDPAGGNLVQQGLDRRRNFRLPSVEVIAGGTVRGLRPANPGDDPGTLAAGRGAAPLCPAGPVSGFKPGHRKNGPGSIRILGKEDIRTQQSTPSLESEGRLAVHPAFGNPFRRRVLGRQLLHGGNLPVVAAPAGVLPGLEGLVLLELDGVSLQPDLQLGCQLTVSGGSRDHSALPLHCLLADSPGLWPDGAVSDPLLQGGDLTLRQRTGGRHLQIPGTPHQPNKAALIHLPRHHRRTRLAPLAQKLGRIQAQPSLLQPGTVAHLAVLHQQGADLLLEELDPGGIGFLTRGGDRDRRHQEGQEKETNQHGDSLTENG